MQSVTPKIGVVGVGFIGRIHLRALREAGLSVVAIADPSEAARQEAAALVPEARQYADWKDLLKDPEVEAVNICTINALHFPILKAVVESGKHAFCEKTMTVSAAEATEALSLECAPGQIVQIGYMKRF